MSTFPYDGQSQPQKIAEIDAYGVAIEEKSKKVRKGTVGDAISGPRTMVVHFGHASTVKPFRC